eukprot:UC4_evm2s44
MLRFQFITQLFYTNLSLFLIFVLSSLPPSAQTNEGLDPNPKKKSCSVEDDSSAFRRNLLKGKLNVAWAGDNLKQSCTNEAFTCEDNEYGRKAENGKQFLTRDACPYQCRNKAQTICLADGETLSPTQKPTRKPTAITTLNPTTLNPTTTPTENPTETPTKNPSTPFPTHTPTRTTTANPTNIPSSGTTAQYRTSLTDKPTSELSALLYGAPTITTTRSPISPPSTREPSDESSNEVFCNFAIVILPATTTAAPTKVPTTPAPIKEWLTITFRLIGGFLDIKDYTTVVFLEKIVHNFTVKSQMSPRLKEVKFNPFNNIDIDIDILLCENATKNDTKLFVSRMGSTVKKADFDLLNINFDKKDIMVVSTEGNWTFMPQTTTVQPKTTAETLSTIRSDELNFFYLMRTKEITSPTPSTLPVLNQKSTETYPLINKFITRTFSSTTPPHFLPTVLQQKGESKSSGKDPVMSNIYIVAGAGAGGLVILFFVMRSCSRKSKGEHMIENFHKKSSLDYIENENITLQADSPGVSVVDNDSILTSKRQSDGSESKIDDMISRCEDNTIIERSSSLKDLKDDHGYLVPTKVEPEEFLQESNDNQVRDVLDEETGEIGNECDKKNTLENDDDIRKMLEELDSGISKQKDHDNDRPKESSNSLEREKHQSIDKICENNIKRRDSLISINESEDMKDDDSYHELQANSSPGSNDSQGFFDQDSKKSEDLGFEKRDQLRVGIAGGKTLPRYSSITTHTGREKQYSSEHHDYNGEGDLFSMKEESGSRSPRQDVFLFDHTAVQPYDWDDAGSMAPSDVMPNRHEQFPYTQGPSFLYVPGNASELSHSQILSSKGGSPLSTPRIDLCIYSSDFQMKYFFYNLEALLRNARRERSTSSASQVA